MMNNQSTDINLYELYLLLKEDIGRKIDWWPAKNKEEMIVGAILTQNTNWNNVEKALVKIEELTDFNPKRINELDEEILIEAIRTTGFYGSKAKCIKSVFKWICDNDAQYNQMVITHENIEKTLLSIKGIGDETKDAICLYVFGIRKFISDNYARKLVKLLGVSDIKTYKCLDKRVILSDDFDTDMLKEFHGLIVEFGKKYINNKKFHESPLSGIRLKL